MMDKKSNLALLTMAIGVFMGALDNGIVTSSLTTLFRSFHVSPSWGAWMITIYTLGLAISVPIVGKLSDRFGRKKLFLIEIAIFGIGSLLVALSPNFTSLLAARFFQAMGGGGIFIIASAYVLDMFPKEKQGRALGMLGGMNGIAAILGPNLGSFLLHVTGNWHWLFLINIPIAVVLLIMGQRTIVETTERKHSRMDIAGIMLLSGAALALMYGLTQLKGTDLMGSFFSSAVISFVLLSIALLFVLYVVEKKLRFVVLIRCYLCPC
jgi:multidrug resistance protein